MCPIALDARLVVVPHPGVAVLRPVVQLADGVVVPIQRVDVQKPRVELPRVPQLRSPQRAVDRRERPRSDNVVERIVVGVPVTLLDYDTEQQGGCVSVAAADSWEGMDQHDQTIEAGEAQQEIGVSDGTSIMDAKKASLVTSRSRSGPSPLLPKD